MQEIKFMSPADKLYYEKAWDRYMAKRESIQRILANKESYQFTLQPTPMKPYMPKTMKEARAEIKSLRETCEQLRKDLDAEAATSKQTNIICNRLRNENTTLVGLLKSINTISGAANNLTYRF